MSQKQCPACGQMVYSCEGSELDYIRFECPTHGNIEIHEYTASHNALPGHEQQMRQLSSRISALRERAPNALLTMKEIPVINAVDLKAMRRKQ